MIFSEAGSQGEPWEPDFRLKKVKKYIIQDDLYINLIFLLNANTHRDYICMHGEQFPLFSADILQYFQPAFLKNTAVLDFHSYQDNHDDYSTNQIQPQPLL